MPITGVRTQLYEIPLTRPLGDANSPKGRRTMASLAVFLETDEGLTGVSIANPHAQIHIHNLVEKLLQGRDPRGVVGLWKRMVDFVFKGGNRGTITGAIAAIDIALWDLKARSHNEPLWQTLGADTARVKAYASGIDMPLSDDDLRTYYESMARKGICAGKLKIGLDLDMDLRRIGIMKEALALFGQKPELLLDVNEYWSPKQSIRYLHEIEKRYDITWVEEPARRWDWRGLRRVSQNVRAAVATGENLDNLSDYVSLIPNGAVDVLNLSHGVSGITGAMQLAHLAYAFEIPVSMMNCPGNFMAHLAAALPNHYMMEVVDAGRDKILITDNRIEDGWIVLGNSPGLGITLDEEKLAKYRVDQPSPQSTPSPWGRRRGAGMYLVGPGEPEELGQG